MAEHEILYHGKDKSTGEWIEGCYTKAKWYLDEKEIHIILPVDIVFFLIVKYQNGMKFSLKL